MVSFPLSIEIWGYFVLKVSYIFNIFSAPHIYPTCIEKMFVKCSRLFCIVLEDIVLVEIVSILFIT